MSAQYERLEKCYEYYRSVTDFVPRVGLILGSGLGGYAKNMKVEKEIPYGDIPGFPVSTVEGHDVCIIMKDIPWKRSCSRPA